MKMNTKGMAKRNYAALIHNSTRTGGKAVVLFDLEGNELRREPSARLLSIYLEMSKSAVRESIDNGGTLKGMYKAKWAKDVTKIRPEPRSSMERKK